MSEIDANSQLPAPAGRPRPIRVGVIGCGAMGGHHARIYAQHPDADLVGVFDPDRARVAAVTGEWGGRGFASPKELLRQIEAVSIASPTQTHEAAAMQALEHEVHLLVEKPLAGTLAGARRLVARAGRRSALVVQVGHIERFNPTVRALARLLDGQRIVSVTMQRLHPFHQRCLDSDVIQDLMIHDLDLALALFGGRLELTHASGGRHSSDRIDHATAYGFLRGAAGGEATWIMFSASRVATRKVRAITALTAGAYYTADLLERTIAIHRTGGRGLLTPSGEVVAIPELRSGTLPECLRAPAEEPLRLELDHFLACVRDQRRPLVDARAGLRALTHATAIGALIERENATVTIPRPGERPEPVMPHVAS